MEGDTPLGEHHGRCHPLKRMPLSAEDAGVATSPNSRGTIGDTKRGLPSSSHEQSSELQSKVPQQSHESSANHRSHDLFNPRSDPERGSEVSPENPTYFTEPPRL